MRLRETRNRLEAAHPSRRAGVNSEPISAPNLTRSCPSHQGQLWFHFGSKEYLNRHCLLLLFHAEREIIGFSPGFPGLSPESSTKTATPSEKFLSPAHSCVAVLAPVHDPSAAPPLPCIHLSGRLFPGLGYHVSGFRTLEGFLRLIFVSLRAPVPPRVPWNRCANDGYKDLPL
jgi:hypothetical protein